jgi:uncharacterized membrane protein YraQ (UPF0718 family)
MPRQRKPGRWLFLALVLAGYGVAAVIAPDLAYRACAGFVAMLEKVAPALALVFVLMLLGEMLLSNERVENWLGRGSGLRGWFLALAAGVLSAGPAYTWYALLAELRAKGMRTALAAVFLYARAIKLPLLPLLAHYFGLRYMIVLSLFIAAFSILNGRIMEQLERPAESA